MCFDTWSGVPNFLKQYLHVKFSFLIFLWYATTFGGFFRGGLDCDVEGDWFSKEKK